MNDTGDYYNAFASRLAEMQIQLQEITASFFVKESIGMRKRLICGVNAVKYPDDIFTGPTQETRLNRTCARDNVCLHTRYQPGRIKRRQKTKSSSRTRERQRD